MKLSEWAKKQGVSYRTAWRWFQDGSVPNSKQMDSGTILVDVPELSTNLGAVVYARVSSADQKSDLDRQLARILTFANDNKLTVAATVTEIGSALNGKRSKLLKLLSDPEIKLIIVEHRDRLMRFGLEYVDAALRSQGRRIVIVEEQEVSDDLVRDMIEVLTSFCARLYGRRAAKAKAERALKAINDES